MDIKRAAARLTKIALEDKFAGQVWQDEALVEEAPSRMRATNNSFSPRARTAWNSHPVGQTLYCASSIGLIQLEGNNFRS